MARSVAKTLGGGLAAVALLGACSGDDPSTAQPPSAVEQPDVLPIVGFAWRDSLPFYLANEDNQRLYAAWQRGVESCMTDSGFTYSPIEYPVEVDDFDRLHPLDLAHVRQYGYSNPPFEPADNNNYDDPAFLRVFEGPDGDNGCYQESFDAVYGAVAGFTQDVDQTIGSMESRLGAFVSDPAGVAAAADWSRCMTERGYDYDNPFEPFGQFGDEETPSPANLETRLVHFECDVSTGYTTARHDFEQTAFDSWIAENETVVADLVDRKSEFDQQVVRFNNEL